MVSITLTILNDWQQVSSDAWWAWSSSSESLVVSRQIAFSEHDCVSGVFEKEEWWNHVPMFAVGASFKDAAYHFCQDWERLSQGLFYTIRSAWCRLCDGTRAVMQRLGHRWGECTLFSSIKTFKLSRRMRL